MTKQVTRRAHPENLGMDLRLLLARSVVGDHDGEPQQELVDALCMDAIENEGLQALDADERAALSKLLTRALQGVEHIADDGQHPTLATASS